MKHDSSATFQLVVGEEHLLEGPVSSLDEAWDEASKRGFRMVPQPFPDHFVHLDSYRQENPRTAVIYETGSKRIYAVENRPELPMKFSSDDLKILEICLLVTAANNSKEPPGHLVTTFFTNDEYGRLIRLIVKVQKERRELDKVEPLGT